MKLFVKVEVQVIKRELNAQADDLAKIASFGKFTKKNKMTIAEVSTVTSSELEAEIPKVFMIQEKTQGWVALS